MVRALSGGGGDGGWECDGCFGESWCVGLPIGTGMVPLGSAGMGQTGVDGLTPVSASPSVFEVEGAGPAGTGCSWEEGGAEAEELDDVSSPPLGGDCRRSGETRQAEEGFGGWEAEAEAKAESAAPALPSVDAEPEDSDTEPAEWDSDTTDV